MDQRQIRRVSFSVSMLGWAFNEEENIGQYIERAEQFLQAIASDYELIIIDDGSDDRTWEIAKAYQQTRPWLRLYQNERNRGSGYSGKRAFALAEKDYLFWQTIDWAYDISRLGECMPLLKQYDVLQGFRPHTLSLRGIVNRSDNVQKAFVSITNYLLIRLLFGLPLHDYQNVAVYPRRLIHSFEIETESAFVAPECLLKVWWQGAAIKEVPVPFIKRTKGVAKGTRLRTIMRAIRDILSGWWKWIVLGKRSYKGKGQIISWDESTEELRIDYEATYQPTTQPASRLASE